MKRGFNTFECHSSSNSLAESAGEVFNQGMRKEQWHHWRLSWKVFVSISYCDVHRASGTFYSSKWYRGGQEGTCVSRRHQRQDV